MRCSQRALDLEASATLALAARVKALRAEGKDVLGFSAGEPDLAPPLAAVAAVRQAIEEGKHGYEPVPGTPEAREAIAAFHRKGGIDCSADDIVLTAGGKMALFLVLQALLEPGRGDEVVILTPAWVSYKPMIELCGGKVVEVPCTFEDGFRPDPEAVAAAVTPNTAAVMLNSPGNPTGVAFPDDVVERIAAAVAAHPHAMLISDEIYATLRYGNASHCSPAALPGMKDRVITLHGLSKIAAVTGWRLGWVVAPMLTERGETLAKILTRIQGQSLSHTSSLVMPAVAAVLGGEADEDLENMRLRFADRAARMHQHLSRIDGIKCIQPEGAFYCFPDVGDCFGKVTPTGKVLTDVTAFCEALLEEALVAVVPGAPFGPGGERCVRMSFACGEETIDAGCERLATFVSGLQDSV
ncbi:MAG: aspartate aminotransferase [Phycisphaerae bacterium]|nr:aspartate aminotransferase [Phycisphaerae bacterium]